MECGMNTIHGMWYEYCSCMWNVVWILLLFYSTLDKNVKEKLQEVYEQLRGRKQKEKAMYQAMFNTAS